MYRFIKLLFFSVLPKEFILKHQFVLRSINHFLFYRGNQYLCNLCNAKSKKFIIENNGAETLCPKCGSLSRTRSLWIWLNLNQFLDKDLKVLHFSPHRFLQKKLQSIFQSNYVSTDIEGNYTTKNHDITEINEPDEYFDLIICFHVLEHVIDDKKAMKELYRILKPSGKLVLQVPFKEGETYEDFSIVSPEERLKAFGQEDHVRHYGLTDFVERLTTAGFKTSVIKPAELKEINRSLHQIKPTETFVIAYK